MCLMLWQVPDWIFPSFLPRVHSLGSYCRWHWLISLNQRRSKTGKVLPLIALGNQPLLITVPREAKQISKVTQLGNGRGKIPMESWAELPRIHFALDFMPHQTHLPAVNFAAFYFWFLEFFSPYWLHRARIWKVPSLCQNAMKANKIMSFRALII